jgi:sodium/bile acid cotransporter 7
MKTTGESPALLPVVLDLLRWLVLPLVLGQALRPVLGAWAVRHKARISIADRLTILLLVYTSFCDSFKQHVWTGHGVGQIVIVAGVCLALFVLVMFITSSASRALGFTREDRVAAMFCGSKKTLASGVPMAKLIFGAHPGLGLILLPIMIYHPLQLVICGVLAERWGRQTDKPIAS